jgi:hypothetical protein
MEPQFDTDDKRIGARATDSNYYSLPLGRMDGAKAPSGQECGLRRTDGRDKKRTVAETADIMRS